MAMDEGTALVLAVQLTALASIAGSLLLYLLWKARRAVDGDPESRLGRGRSILVTCSETALGLQLALHLSSLGFRVFAGVKDPQGDAAKVLAAKLKAAPAQTAFFVLPVDVTREDSLHEAVDHVRRHLPAGENGLWAIINTAGIVVKGKLENQESCQWESMLKVNVVGTLRTARVFLPLLKGTKGRLMTIGLSGECNIGTGVVAYTAARHAVAGASGALNNELSHLGVHVITVNTGPITADALYHGIRVRKDPVPNESLQQAATLASTDPYMKYKTNALPRYALEILEEALFSEVPKKTYDLLPPVGISNYFLSISEKLKANKQSCSFNTV